MASFSSDPALGTAMFRGRVAWRVVGRQVTIVAVELVPHEQFYVQNNTQPWTELSRNSIMFC
jgi:hypothetical protein